MGALVADFDWGSTPLGDPQTWPLALRAAVQMCLSTRFPVLVVCGPEMRKIYNDGYREMLGEQKHPGALGAPAADVWSEIWDTIGPLFRRVFETAKPTWSQDQHLVIERNGYPEDCYFTYSYSPVLDEDGAVVGVVDIATETTAAVVAHERLSCLTDLAGTLVEVEGVTDVCLQATAVLSRWPASVQAADIYLRVDEHLALVSSNRRGQHPSVDPVVADGRSIVEVLDAQPPTGRPVDDVTVPIGGSSEGAVGVMVLSLNPSRPYDSAYAQFVELAARAIGAALDRAHRHATEVDEYRVIGDTLQQAMLQPAGDFEHVAARYLPATGNLAVGGDWYDVIELAPDRWALVVGDCVGHGLDAAAAMSQLRSAARAMLLQGNDPAEMLDGLNVFAGSVEGAFCATVVCTVVDAGDRTVTYARAGHPFPLIVSPDGPTWLDEAGGTPLGFDTETEYVSASRSYAPGDILVLCSDGLIERRGEDLDLGFGRLADGTTGLRSEPVEQIADQLISDLLPDVPTDDVVVVVKRLPGSVS